MTKTRSAATSPIASTILLLLALLPSACNRRDEEIRSYKEVNYRPAPAAAPEAPFAGGTAVPSPSASAMTGTVPTASLSIEWSTPEGWAIQPERPMRLATFRAGSTECTVTAFPGDTGGEEANLGRWLGQLQVQADAATLQSVRSTAVSFTTEGGWSGRLFNLTPAAPAGTAQGMRAAIIPAGSQTVFVKLAGPPAELDTQAEALSSFCRSIRPRR